MVSVEIIDGEDDGWLGSYVTAEKLDPVEKNNFTNLSVQYMYIYVVPVTE